MEEKKEGCGCGSKKVVAQQPFRKVTKFSNSKINKVYKTKTSIFN
jgi:hypothetical protein